MFPSAFWGSDYFGIDYWPEAGAVDTLWNIGDDITLAVSVTGYDRHLRSDANLTRAAAELVRTAGSNTTWPSASSIDQTLRKRVGTTKLLTTPTGSWTP